MVIDRGEGGRGAVEDSVTCLHYTMQQNIIQSISPYVGVFPCMPAIVSGDG